MKTFSSLKGNDKRMKKHKLSNQVKYLHISYSSKDVDPRFIKNTQSLTNNPIYFILFFIEIYFYLF